MSKRIVDVLGRENFPIADGCLFYFPDALAYVSLVSKKGNDKHNPGQPMHWSMGKSTDHENKIMRHLTAAAETDDETELLHAGAMAWRALAHLQTILIKKYGLDLPPNGRYDEDAPAEVKPVSWITFNGDGNPVGDVQVQVQLRNGEILAGGAGGFTWAFSTTRSDYDIIRYRVIP